MKGRKPKDPARKAAEGARTRAKPAKAPEIAPAPALPADAAPPPTLRPAAVEVWMRVVPQLKAWDKMSSADRELLAGFCSLMARHYECEEFLMENGMTYIGVTGMVKEFPQVRISGQTLNQARLIGESFGFSPQSRVRLGASDQTEENDPLDDV